MLFNYKQTHQNNKTQGQLYNINYKSNTKRFNNSEDIDINDNRKNNGKMKIK